MEKITLHTIAVLISHIYDHPLSDPICHLDHLDHLDHLNHLDYLVWSGLVCRTTFRMGLVGYF